MSWNCSSKWLGKFICRKKFVAPEDIGDVYDTNIHGKLGEQADGQHFSSRRALFLGQSIPLPMALRKTPLITSPTAAARLCLYFFTAEKRQTWIYGRTVDRLRSFPYSSMYSLTFRRETTVKLLSDSPILWICPCVRIWLCFILTLFVFFPIFFFFFFLIWNLFLLPPCTEFHQTFFVVFLPVPTMSYCSHS